MKEYPCACGCEETTRWPDTFAPGHDVMALDAVAYACGGGSHPRRNFARFFGFGPGMRNARAEVLAGRRAAERAS